MPFDRKQKNNTQTHRQMKAHALTETLKNYPFTIVARRDWEKQDPKHTLLPASLNSEVKRWMESKYSKGLYSHQAEALEQFLSGSDVALMTPTASGKSAIFQAAAAHANKAKGGSKTLALFPLKALAQDQARSWAEMGEALGLKIGVIHGGQSKKGSHQARLQKLQECDVILATPDVIHCWFMANLDKKEVKAFRGQLGLLVLDEAHTFDGEFGTNMALFVARLRACGSDFQIICASATMGAPGKFLSTLLGKMPAVINQSGSSAAARQLLTVRYARTDKDRLIGAIHELAASVEGQCLVFIDNRAKADHIAQLIESHSENATWLAYRNGYEEEDREEIQNALTQGNLKGIVSTSALEAGISIDGIELVIMLDRPKKMRSFLQRFGRLRGEGCAIIFDADWPQDAAEVEEWMKRPVEENRLYLDDEVICLQAAFCAKEEQAAVGDDYRMEVFDHLGIRFKRALHLVAHRDEIFDTSRKDVLKRAQNGEPHREFSLRNIERQYQAKAKDSDLRCGSFTESQVFREAYPGAIYRYLKRSYRVLDVNRRTGEIKLSQLLKPNPKESTSPDVRISASADFRDSDSGKKAEGIWLAEVVVNLDETVVGYKQKVDGGSTQTISYQDTGYKPLTRTTYPFGLAVTGPDLNKAALTAIKNAYCVMNDFDPSDLDVVKLSGVIGVSLPQVTNAGWAIANKPGTSARLTGGLLVNWFKVLKEALRSATDPMTVGQLSELIRLSASLQSWDVQNGSAITKGSDSSGLVRVFWPKSRVFIVDAHGNRREAVVEKYVYRPEQGWCYRYNVEGSISAWVKHSHVEEIPGISVTALYNRDTDEFEPTPALAA
jgi:DEAD/DEAH box helicase domain-containing protein